VCVSDSHSTLRSRQMSLVMAMIYTIACLTFRLPVDYARETNRALGRQHIFLSLCAVVACLSERQCVYQAAVRNATISQDTCHVTQ